MMPSVTASEAGTAQNGKLALLVAHALYPQNGYAALAPIKVLRNGTAERVKPPYWVGRPVCTHSI